MRIKLNNLGFSLVELLVVVGIIAVLVMAVMPKYHSYKARSRRAEARVNLGQLAALQGIYATQHDTFYGNLPLVSRDGGCASTQAKELGFKPDECVYMRYGYEMTGGVKTFTATAFGPSDGDGRWIYPKCTGAGSTECGSASGDKLIVSHNSEVRVCRDIVKYCPVGVSPPPTYTPGCDCTTGTGAWGAWVWQPAHPSTLCPGDYATPERKRTDTTTCTPSPGAPPGQVCPAPVDNEVAEAGTPVEGTKSGCCASKCIGSVALGSRTCTPDPSICKGSSYLMPCYQYNTREFTLPTNPCSGLTCPPDRTFREDGSAWGVGTNTNPPCTTTMCSCDCGSGAEVDKSIWSPSSDTECPGTSVWQEKTVEVPYTCSLKPDDGVSPCPVPPNPVCNNFTSEEKRYRQVDGTKPDCGDDCDCGPWVDTGICSWSTTPKAGDICEGTDFLQSGHCKHTKTCTLPPKPKPGLVCKDEEKNVGTSRIRSGTKKCKARPETIPCSCDVVFSNSDSSELCIGDLPHTSSDNIAPNYYSCSCDPDIVTDTDSDGTISEAEKDAQACTSSKTTHSFAFTCPASPVDLYNYSSVVTHINSPGHDGDTSMGNHTHDSLGACLGGGCVPHFHPLVRYGQATTTLINATETCGWSADKAQCECEHTVTYTANEMVPP